MADAARIRKEFRIDICLRPALKAPFKDGAALAAAASTANSGPAFAAKL
ncbi:MAG TPA: hypothetical protein VJ353_11285 [Xanthobacteraceae bacterium]|nr:hypothetical protein [Xanthobacteraceae bacterium]